MTWSSSRAAGAIRVEQHRGVRAFAQQRQAGAGQQKGGIQVDLQDFVPEFRFEVRNGHQCAEQRGVVQQPVEAAEFRFERCCQVEVILLGGAFQIHGVDRCLRAAGCLDGVVDLLQVTYDLVEQDYGGAVAGAGHGDRRTDAAAGAGDENNALLQVIGRRLPVVGDLHRCSLSRYAPAELRMAAAQFIPLRTALSSVAGRPVSV